MSNRKILNILFKYFANSFSLTPPVDHEHLLLLFLGAGGGRDGILIDGDCQNGRLLVVADLVAQVEALVLADEIRPLLGGVVEAEAPLHREHVQVNLSRARGVLPTEGVGSAEKRKKKEYQDKIFKKNYSRETFFRRNGVRHLL